MSSTAMKPVPMKLFAAWEVDRTPSNCIPRLCSLTVTRLTLLTPLPSDVTSVSLAVKMQSSKRILRSHEIPLGTVTSHGVLSTQQSLQSQHSSGQISTPMGQNSMTSPVMNSQSIAGIAGGNQQMQQQQQIQSPFQSVLQPQNSSQSTLLEAELDLHFSLQYPHFIKRDGNRLQILLQRRKKYKSRTILGYKTLCEGSVRMDQVLQRSRDMLIDLGGDGKSTRKSGPLARLSAYQVSSIPVDHDKQNSGAMLADRVAEYSDDDEEAEFSSGEDNEDQMYAAGGVGVGVGGVGSSGSGAQPGKERGLANYRKLQRSADEAALGGHGDSDSEFEHSRKGAKMPSNRQRNLKQKFVALLRRFRVPEELEAGVTGREAGALGGAHEIDALFQELESLSCGEADDSAPELDTMSISSTPKPSLRPFFSSSRSLLYDSTNLG